MSCSLSDSQPQLSYCEREFLHPPTTGKNSYISAIAESSQDGQTESAQYVLVIADCHHAIELEFSLINANERQQSLAKVDTLANIINRFRDALRAEATAIESIKTRS